MAVVGVDRTVDPDLLLITAKFPSFQSLAATKAALRTPVMKELCFLLSWIVILNGL